MEMAAAEQGHIVPNFEVEHQDDIIDINRDDEFDFEIGGDENLAPVEDVNDANGNITDEADGMEVHGTDVHVNDSYTYQLQEQAVQASVVDSHAQESRDQYHEELDLEASAFDALGDTAGFTDAAQDDGQGVHEYYGQDENGEEHVEDASHVEIDYEETAGEFDGFTNVTQSEIGHDHDLANAATSVEYVPEEDDFQEPTDEAETDPKGAEVDTSILQDGEVPEKNAEDFDATGEYETEEVDDAQDASAAADVQNRPIGGDSADATVAQHERSTEVLDASLDQSNWNADDQENQNSTVRPNVTVSYRGQEYFLFAENPDEDPDTYFLDEVDSIHQPLAQFLGEVRQVISSEVETGHEIFMKVDGLGLEFGESTAKDFLDQTTFAQIIDVNNKLVQQDGGSKSPELYIYLSVRSNPLQRFTELTNGADEGRGLSNFEKYYDETSADVSATNEEGLDDFTQDILSDDLSFDDTHEQTDGATDAAGDSYNAQQHRNPFRVGDDKQEPLVDATISGVAETEETETETLAVNDKINDVFDRDAIVNAELAGVEENSNLLGLDATDVEAISFDNALGDVISVSGQIEEDVVESWDDSRDVAGQDVEAAGELEEETEVQIDFSKEIHERTDGENHFSLRESDCFAPGPCLCDLCDDPTPPGFEGGAALWTTAQASTPFGSTIYKPILEGERDFLMTDSHMDNTVADKILEDPAFDATNDDDYLDLDDGDDQLETALPPDTANNDAGGRLGTPRPLSHSSSASATLDGDDSGHGDDAAVTQTSADPIQAQDLTEFDASQPEVDEIDWNHDEDDEVGAAAQNPAGLSPSSPSAKRSRQEDESASGLGEEIGMCWACIDTPPPQPKKKTSKNQPHANLSPAVKRRRT